MMGFGFLFMLLVVVLPVVGVLVLIVWVINSNKMRNRLDANPLFEKRTQPEGPKTKLTCSHCGANLQDDWIHCPQCGATVQSSNPR